MVKTKHSRQSGFSLVETMLAMLLLGISFLALGQLIGVAINQNALSRSTSVGITVAMGKMEELRRIYNQQLAAGGVTLASGSSTETMRFDNSLQGTETSSNVRSYAVKWTVTPVAGSTSELQVKVEVGTGQNPYQSRTVEIYSHFAP